MNQEEALLLKMFNALVVCKGSREFANVLIRELRRYLKFDVAGLYMYSACSETLSCISPEHLEVGTPGYEISQLSASGSMKHAAATRQQAVFSENIVTSKWTEGRIVGKWHKASSAIVAPLVLPSLEGKRETNRTIGVMFVGRHQQGGLSEADRLFMEKLGLQIAPSFQAVLALEERDALMAIDERAVVGTVTLETLLSSIKDVIQKVIPNDGSALIQMEGRAEDFSLKSISVDQFLPDLAQFSRLPFSKALETAQPLFLTGHNHCEYPEIPYLASIGMLSSLVTPLYNRDKAFGFFLIGSRRRNAFSDRDMTLCEYLGHHLSQAISNILAFAEIQNLKNQIERENRYLREAVKDADHRKKMVGESPAFLKMMGTITQIAPTDSTVLIMGETGTGKELVSQTLYEASPRRDKAFIRVNCATLPENLIESELFGHEKGAFTHATARRIGRFELANDGTLFLDEVGELPLTLQSKLLRAIESQEFERLGGMETIKVDVRILAATNVNLEAAVKSGAFRADLFYRLKVLPLTIPPLRERQEDIPQLIHYFLERHAARHRKAIQQVNPRTMDALCSYHWPGNIRELNHLIERAVILTQGPELVVEEIEANPPLVRPAPSSSSSPPEHLDEVERAHILNVLNQCNWVVSGPVGAAKRLGVHRATLQYRMKKLGIEKLDPKGVV